MRSAKSYAMKDMKEHYDNILKEVPYYGHQ